MSDENGTTGFSEGSPSVQTHLEILQGVIERMASNSALVKGWCITVVSAVLVVVADKEKPSYALLAMIPTILFFALDAYYLAMEKGFRNAYNSFVKRLHSGSLSREDLYAVKPEGATPRLLVEAIRSFSVWGFYPTLVVLIGLARWLILA
jgi:hypothetical protein